MESDVLQDEHTHRSISVVTLSGSFFNFMFLSHFLHLLFDASKPICLKYSTHLERPSVFLQNSLIDISKCISAMLILTHAMIVYVSFIVVFGQCTQHWLNTWKLYVDDYKMYCLLCKLTGILCKIDPFPLLEVLTYIKPPNAN